MQKLLTLCLVLLLPVCLSAQLWPGSLGEPVFAEHFDADNLPLGATTFAATPGCPEKGGQYTLTNFLAGCGKNDTIPPWLTVQGDHTRLLLQNQNSKVMAINGGGVPGTVYQTKVDGLCSNITYQFTAFVANVMKEATCGGNPALPNLTFTATDAQGNVLKTFTTGSVPLQNYIIWQELGFYFTLPASATPITLKITSIATGGCGSTFAIDDITLRPCGTAINVTLDDSTLSSIDVCDGYTNPFILRANFTGFINPQNVWQESLDTGRTWHDIPGANAASYAIPHFADGIKIYRVSAADGANFTSPKCRVSSSPPIYVSVYPHPLKQPLTYVSACLDKNLVMPFIPGGAKYHWSGPNGFESELTQAVVQNIQYRDTGYYKVIAISDFGCPTTDSVYVTVSPSVTITTAKTEYNVCEGEVIKFDITGAGKYLWEPATNLSSSTIGNPTLVVTDSARYKVSTQNQYGCRDSLFIIINMYHRTQVNAGADVYMLAGDTVTLNGSIKGTALQYYWSPGSYLNYPTKLTPAATPPAGNWEYTLQASSTQGCGNAGDAVTVHVYNDMYIPNAFTPNGDGKNDVFGILPLSNYKLVRFTIYSRWGSVLFTSASPGATWDGNYNSQPQPTGAYIYFVEMLLPNGKKLGRKGQVMLIR